MLVISQILELKKVLNQHKSNKKQIGLVPTMGALHQGHISLIKRAIRECDAVVVSIFVNPLQFAPNEDLDRYPRTLEVDYKLCEELGVEIVFAPSTAEIGITGDIATQVNTTTVVPPESMTSGLCGKYRPKHFVGVATIVTKLFNIVQPDRAYFGQKDAQQLAIIRRLVKDFDFAVEVIGCSIVREKSGLALSSRNQYLTDTEKTQATILHRSLQQAAVGYRKGIKDTASLIEMVKERLATVPEVKIQYVRLVDPDTLQPLEIVEKTGLIAIAACVGKTRLIDNIILRQPIVAIDGPAGSGKSTVTRRVAKKLGLLYLDTGAMYRAVTWLVMNSNIAIDNESAVASLIKEVQIDLIPRNTPDLPVKVYLNHQEVTQAIRTPEVTNNVSTIAAQAAVRKQLVKTQQDYGKQGGIIAEGRDIGTNVFPDAELKIFLTASPHERARRRLLDLQNQGYQDINLQQLEREIIERDTKDSNRQIAPLKKADDAIEIITDNLSIEQVIERIVQLYRSLQS